MASGRYHINPSGYRAVLNGPEALAACSRAASSVSGDGYVTDTLRGRNRVHARISVDKDLSWPERKRKIQALKAASPRI